MTRSSSSAAGLPVRTKAGLTLAAIPKSVIQISPGLTAGMFVLQAIGHHGSLRGGLIAECDIRVLVSNLQKHFPNGPTICLSQLGQFFDDLGGAHDVNINWRKGVVRGNYGRNTIKVGEGEPFSTESSQSKANTCERRFLMPHSVVSTKVLVEQLADLQRRVATLEKGLTLKSRGAWKRIVGSSKGQALDREAARLGAQWRAKQNKRK